LSLRALIIGLAGVVLVSVIVAETELVYVQAGFLQLPPAALGGLLILAGARALLRRSHRWRLEAHEVAIIYCMLLIAALAGSRGLIEKMLPLLVAPDYYANDTNHWRDRFFPHMQRWLVAFDPKGPPGQTIARAYYEALRAGEPIPWHAWLLPLSAWSVLAGLVFFAFLCLASLMRRPWMEHERLAFPLAQLPLEMAREEGKASLMRSPLTWLGFALPGFVYTLNGLHTFYPAVPHLEQPFTLNQYLVDPPWSAVSWMPVYLSFAAIGLLYLVPGPLLFSLWFFFLLTRLQELAAAAYGFQPPGMPFFPCKQFIGYQTLGAYTVLAVYILYTAAPRLRLAARSLFQPGAKQSGRDELLSDRAAVAGLLFCLVGMSLWCALAGMSFWWALAQWLVYLFVVILVLGRSTAEGGLISTEVSFRPADLYVMIRPIHFLGPANMTAMAFMDAAWFRDQRSMVFAGVLDAMRIGRGTGVRRRAMLGALVLSLLLATACGIVIQLWLPYRQGALQFYGYLFQGNPIWGFQYYLDQWNNPPPFRTDHLFWFGTGILVTLTLATLRSLLPWWPLHPLGYALCGSWTMILLWFPCLLTWLLKGALLRYGGMRAFVRFRPLFLGMILGEFTMAIVWTGIGALAHAPAPAFPWP
jgi:hypothetical protein